MNSAGYVACAFRRLPDSYSKPLFGQDVLHYVAPLYQNYYVRIAHYLSQLIGYHAGFVQAVKIEMMNFKTVGYIHLTNGECRAGDFVVRLRAARQTADESSLAPAEVAY